MSFLINNLNVKTKHVEYPLKDYNNVMLQYTTTIICAFPTQLILDGIILVKTALWTLGLNDFRTT